MGLFKKKNKINSKFNINDFVAFHCDNDLKHGVIYHIYEENNIIYYDIMVGGEATWLCKKIEESKVLKVK